MKRYVARAIDPFWEAVKKEVFKRDNWTCQRCMKRNKRGLSAHHMKPRAWGGNDVSHNLISLCEPCHNIVEARTDEAGRPLLRAEIKIMEED